MSACSIYAMQALTCHSYVWLSKPPNGPTVKMHLQNLHTMEELHFTGNCLKGSRPILSFDATFETEPHLKLIKELLTHTFGVPKAARKSKPFIDHVMGFTVAEGRIWIRCYQIDEAEVGKLKPAEKAALIDGGKTKGSKSKDKNEETNLTLVEIGPRFVLTPIVIQESSFGGPIIYENKEFVSPNQVRADMRVRKSVKYGARSNQLGKRTEKRGELGLRSQGGVRKERDALDDKVLFA